MTDTIGSIRAEYERYRALGDATIEQVSDQALCEAPMGGGNSIATLVWHLSGNLSSRFTDFLTSDGEKPWRDREAEFEERHVSRPELLAKWNEGWDVLFAALDELKEADLERTVTIRGVGLTVCEALHRSLAHLSYHVGQVVYRGRMAQSEDWTFLSIPPGGSAAYDRDPGMEKPSTHATHLRGERA